MDLTKKGNIKLSVCTCLVYRELKRICDHIESVGYDCYFVDNGNVVFVKRDEEKNICDDWDDYEDDSNGK